jgi:type IV secretory pathway VirD2 relaxase
MKRNPQNIPEPLRPLRRGPIEPDLQRDDFEPRLPTRVLRERGGLIGHLKSASRSSRGTGKRPTTRRQEGVRGRFHSPKTYPQRVVVKARVVSGKGASSLERMRKHRTYLSRSGTGLTGKRPEFFTERGHTTQEALHLEGLTWVNDPHHFRLIISPELGAALDLEDYVRSVMREVSTDLKTKLEWYGVCHHNTDNAHAHVVLRGVDDKGDPLVIAREYLSHGVRHVAEREASVRLGMRNQEEVDRGITKTLHEERFTFIDKELVKERDHSGEGVVRILPLAPEAREFARKARLNKLQRLAFLESKGLCREERTGVWKVDADLEGVLRELSHRRKVEQVVAPFLARREEAKQDLHIYKESEKFPSGELVGTVIAKDLLDELYDKKFLLLSGHDGRNHFIPLGAFSEAEGFECKPGQVVKVVGQKPGKARAEEVIHRFLGERGGEFSLERFQAHVASEVGQKRWKLPLGVSVDEYVERFKARCESLSKAALIEKLSEERWNVPRDIVSRVKNYDAVTQKKLKVSVLRETYRSIDEEVSVKGASWLDRIVGQDNPGLQARGAFGLQVSRAVKKRAQLLEQRGIIQTRDTYAELLRRDERAISAKIEKQYGRTYGTLREGREVSAEVLGYELLSDGYQMVVRTEEGLVMARAVGTREKRFEVGAHVTLSVSKGEGQRRPFIHVTAGGQREGHNNAKGRSL